MKLCDFIDAQCEPILEEWESFAKDIPAAHGMDSTCLRDHANGILKPSAKTCSKAKR